jgi:hypothetical protein
VDPGKTWIPACAGMTMKDFCKRVRIYRIAKSTWTMKKQYGLI